MDGDGGENRSIGEEELEEKESLPSPSDSQVKKKSGKSRPSKVSMNIRWVWLSNTPLSSFYTHLSLQCLGILSLISANVAL